MTDRELVALMAAIIFAENEVRGCNEKQSVFEAAKVLDLTDDFLGTPLVERRLGKKTK